MADGEPPAPGPVTFGDVTYKPLADGQYDAIICGTGLKECILSGLLSVKGKKVLHLDRNSYYGGECASLNLSNLYKKFVKAEGEPPKAYFDALGANRDYNVDLVPKFIMAGGNLVKMLVHSDVTRYLDFKLVDGCYVYKKGVGIGKVPATMPEAVATSLVGFFQKQKLAAFLGFIEKWDAKDQATWKSAWGKEIVLAKMTMQELFDFYGLDKDTAEFVGHAMALQPDDTYLKKPALDCVIAIRLYVESLSRYGKSPFIYPNYGIGGLPEGFSRLCAIHGGTFILNKQVDQILFNADGTVAGVRSGSGDDAEVALAPLVIGDPSYFPATLVKKTGRVIRSICILDHPVKGLEIPDSAQIILPQSQIGRSNDIYVSVVGYAHKVAAKSRYIAIVSTVVETAKPAEEVIEGVKLLGDLITRFDNIVDSFAPINPAAFATTRCFITHSYDASSHFEDTTNEVLKMFESVYGSPLDMSIAAEVATSAQ